MFGYDDCVECTKKECYVLENKLFTVTSSIGINRMTKKTYQIDRQFLILLTS